MNVKDLLDDAGLLWIHNRKESALALVLIAVAATARKRYPRPVPDGEAFKRFVVDESRHITGLEYDMPVPRPDPTGYSASVPLSEVLYKYLRCQLVHEGELPDGYRLAEGIGGMMVLFSGDPVGVPDGFVGTLAVAVQEAPENTELFQNGKTWGSPRKTSQ
jgi:hypothetical protein